MFVFDFADARSHNDTVSPAELIANELPPTIKSFFLDGLDSEPVSEQNSGILFCGDCKEGHGGSATCQ